MDYSSKKLHSFTNENFIFTKNYFNMLSSLMIIIDQKYLPPNTLNQTHAYSSVTQPNPLEGETNVVFGDASFHFSIKKPARGASSSKKYNLAFLNE